jgi:hypothetical protein
MAPAGSPDARGADADRLSAASCELVDRGDVDELTRHVNALVADREWDELVALAARCRLAFERGKQLWAVSAHIEYRLALEAPGRWAAATLEAGDGRFAFGPLPEVAASTHSWSELSPHLRATPQAAMAAHERVLRGDDLTGDLVAASLPEVLDLPLRLEPWEPRYAVAEYRPDKMAAPSPPLPALRAVERRPPPRPEVPTASPPGRAAGPEQATAGRASGPGRGDEVARALEDLVTTWTEESNGRARAAGTTGDALGAIDLLAGPPEEVVELGPATALALMAWAAGSGGAHGRRRGAAPGRFAAWWVLAAVGGLTSDWPLAADQLGEVLHQVRWFAWADDGPTTGWVLRLALEAGSGPHRGQAWALTATDSA